VWICLILLDPLAITDTIRFGHDCCSVLYRYTVPSNIFHSDVSEIEIRWYIPDITASLSLCPVVADRVHSVLEYRYSHCLVCSHGRCPPLPMPTNRVSLDTAAWQPEPLHCYQAVYSLDGVLVRTTGHRDLVVATFCGLKAATTTCAQDRHQRYIRIRSTVRRCKPSSHTKFC
jgi:hypothetical protein